jgi:Protein of unknown function (DUF3592)
MMSGSVPDPLASVPQSEVRAAGKGVIGCLGFALVFLGLFCLIATGVAGWIYYRTRNWIKADATVTRNWQTTHVVTWGNARTNRQHQFNRQRHVERELIGHVEFRYAVNSQPFDGQVEDKFMGNDQQGLTSFLAEYPPGSVHPVYYNPRKPDQIVLERATANEPYIVGMVALATQVFTVIGVILLFVGRRVKVKVASSHGPKTP